MNSIKNVILLEHFLETENIESGFFFVCHASYEVDRAYGVTGAAAKVDTLGLIGQSVILATTESLQISPEYADCFNRLAKDTKVLSNIDPLLMVHSRPELVGMTKLLHGACGVFLASSTQPILIDGSLFPKDRLWMLLDYFWRINPNLPIYVAYTEPQKYSTETDSNGWLSKGVKRLIRIPGFNGYQSPSKMTMLVVIVGHEKERMQITIKNLEPQKIVLVGQGWQQHGDATPHLSKQIVSQLGLDYASTVDTDASIEVGSRDYRATHMAIADLYAKYKDDYNLVVAGNGTKLQSLGAFLACTENRAIAAVYAEPQIYNHSRSSGAAATWVVRLR